MRRSNKNGAWLFGLALAAVSCQRGGDKAELPGDDVVLAQVNSSPITRYDLDLAARTLLSREVLSELDDAGRKQLLESLVQARAIAQKREAELNAKDRLELDKQVAAYREELLVKQYLSKHTKVRPVSPELVSRYYEQNQARFGAEKVRAYELITSPRELSETERLPLMAAARDAVQHKDWSAWTAELQKKHLPLVYQRGTTQHGVSQPALRNLIAQLSLGEASHITFVDGRPYLVRVTEESASPAKPLAAVSAEIRKTLLPEQVKQSVQAASEVVMKDTRVVYR
jgi:hypothetical protein